MAKFLMMNNMNADKESCRGLSEYVRAMLCGSGQVMFQGNIWTGLLFLCGIFWGAYETGEPTVAWGAVLGLVVSTLTGYVLRLPTDEGKKGLWGFNGVLVGCAFPSFLGNTSLMWVALVFCSMMTVWVRAGFNNVMSPWKVNSLTFPFVFLTWIFLFAAKMLQGMPPEHLSPPELAESVSTDLDLRMGAVVTYWLKGIAQVFLIDSWVTGVFFLAALCISSRRAALWAFVGSVLSFVVVLLFEGSAASISHGLFGFSPVLTAIALGATFYQPGWRTTVWALIGTAATVFVQVGMDAMMMPFGLPTLTAPFCLTTWLFLLPLLKIDEKEPDHSHWHDKRKAE